VASKRYLPRSSSQTRPSGRQTRMASTWLPTLPASMALRPWASQAKAPPMVALPSVGSGAKRTGGAVHSAARASLLSWLQPWVSKRRRPMPASRSWSVTPGWTVRKKFPPASCRSPVIPLSRVRFKICPPAGTAPPQMPVRAPWTITGARAAARAFISSWACSIVWGKEMLSAKPQPRDSSRRYSSYRPVIGSCVIMPCPPFPLPGRSPPPAAAGRAGAGPPGRSPPYGCRTGRAAGQHATGRWP